MAFNKVYITNKTAAYTPSTFRGSWAATSSAVTRALEVDKADGGDQALVAHTETSPLALSYCLYRGVTGRLDAQTISGNVDLAAFVGAVAPSEMVWHVHIYVTQGDSDTPRGTLLSNYTDPLTHLWWVNSFDSNLNAPRGRALNAPQALSSLAITAGDRIVVELGYFINTASAGNFQGRIIYGSGVEGQYQADVADNDAAWPTIGTNSSDKVPWIEFSNAITEITEETKVTDLIRETLNAPASGSMQVTDLVREAQNTGSHSTLMTDLIRETAHDATHSISMTTVIREVMRKTDKGQKVIMFVVT